MLGVKQTKITNEFSENFSLIGGVYAKPPRLDSHFINVVIFEKCEGEYRSRRPF